MKTLIFFILCLGSPAVFAGVTFENYCLLWKKNSKAVLKSSVPTIKALYELSGQKSCKKALQVLRTKDTLDLSGKGIKNLSPLQGLYNITTLIINDNELEHLWGIEALSWLEVLEANDNKLHDISALYYSAQIHSIELKNNQITDISPLKEMSLLDYELEGNPVYDISGEIEALDFLLEEREGYINYEYTKTNGKITEEGLKKAAILKDHMFFRTLLDEPENRALLTEESFLMYSDVPLKKIIMANAYGRDLLEELMMHYRKVKKINLSKLPPEHAKAHLDFFSEMRKRNIPFLRYFLTEGSMFPHSKKDLEVLKNYMLKEMKKKPTLSFLTWKKWILQWQADIKRTGVPPSIASGFLS